jgi:hypothetical protein
MERLERDFPLIEFVIKENPKANVEQIGDS